MVKTCSKCGVEKDCSDFSKDNTKKNGLQNYCKSCMKIYRQDPKNRNRILKQMREYEKEYRQREDVKLKRRIINMLHSSLRYLEIKKTDRTHKMLGYSADELVEHLSALNENWQEYQIDHKIPITWFKKETPIHIINDLRNLQLLTEEENKAKGSRYADEVPEEYKKIVESFLK